jgi:mannose-6-phosphate isomerase-like protein (cupin superfamily)
MGEIQELHRHIDDVKPVEVSKGVWERTLLGPDDTSHHNLTVKHQVVKPGTSVTFDDQMSEYQHYVISGCALWGGIFAHSDTAIFVPGNKAGYTIEQAGETDLHLYTSIYKAPKRYFRWAKARAFNFFEAQYTSFRATTINRQLITEEQHAISGAYRMHGLDIQITPPHNEVSPHTNPEESMYFLRGWGEALSEGQRIKVSPGSFVHTPVDVQHGIFNPYDKIAVEYFVLEYIEHDKAWTERGYQTPSLTWAK